MHTFLNGTIASFPKGKWGPLYTTGWVYSACNYPTDSALTRGPPCPTCPSMWHFQEPPLYFEGRSEEFDLRLIHWILMKLDGRLDKYDGPSLKCGQTLLDSWGPRDEVLFTFQAVPFWFPVYGNRYWCSTGPIFDSFLQVIVGIMLICLIMSKITTNKV